MKIIHVLLTATLGSTAFAQSIQQLFMDPSCTGPVVRARSVDSTGCAPLNCVNSVASGLYISQMCALNDPLETARSAFPGGTQILEEYIYSDDTCSAGGSFSLNALSVCIPDEAGSGVYFKFENMKATVDRNAYSDSSCTLKINAMSGYQLVGQCINLLNSTVQGPPDLGSRVFSFYNVPYSNPSGYPTLSSTDTASTTTTSALGYPTLVRSSTTSTVETASTESGYLTSTTTTTDPGYPTLAPSSTTTTETTTTTEPGYPTLRSSRTTSIEATTTTEPGYPTLRSSTTTTSTTTTTETTATSSKLIPKY
ncbi:hypothetical protein BJ741DRAFT_629129 [Chytriomyces cf. hyalinus JEL632]|nr:hypothetical protein BJ741DRAFT_629129 [Chytriomyces cf. hyalinus JEL632]